MASRETINDLGCSSSEEDSNRTDLPGTEGPGVEKTSPVVRRHHPFSVEALMSGKKTDTRGGESVCSTPKGGAVVVSTTGLNSLYLCRETCSPPVGSQMSLTNTPSSPVKSEASESEDCGAWVSASGFSTQPRKFPIYRVTHTDIFTVGMRSLSVDHKINIMLQLEPQTLRLTDRTVHRLQDATI